jgi:2-haloacid dehalogenase
LKYKAVMFDLLSALLDSWTLWDRIAGSSQTGRRWRKRYLELTYAVGAYRPYEALVREAAELEGLPAAYADQLEADWDQLTAWPEVKATLQTLKDAGLKLAVATNCSELLGRRACDRVGVPFDVIVTSERAGFYKPHERPYRLGLEELGLNASETLFVAGSMFDLIGTDRVGLPTYWHNRVAMIPPPGHPKPLFEEPRLEPLTGVVLGVEA